jgi:ankyrin repeat protein
MLENNIDLTKELMNDDEFAFQYAAECGDLNFMNHLIANLKDDEVQALIESDDYISFQVAASNGHLDIVKRLFELAPDKINSMLSYGDYNTFRITVRNSYLQRKKADNGNPP